MQPIDQDPDPSSYEALKRRLIDELREPLLIAIDLEYSRLLQSENIMLSRTAYRRLKWDIVQAIVGSEE